MVHWIQIGGVPGGIGCRHGHEAEGSPADVMYPQEAESKILPEARGSTQSKILQGGICLQEVGCNMVQRVRVEDSTETKLPLGDRAMIRSWTILDIKAEEHQEVEANFEIRNLETSPNLLLDHKTLQLIKNGIVDPSQKLALAPSCREEMIYMQSGVAEQPVVTREQVDINALLTLPMLTMMHHHPSE